ncbi:MAG: hypothetical protein IOC90_05755 [Methylocystis sp.]|nr:hypothetical protein [Methylocystis sp.]MCA3584825.1 hypothetical protein [Methylocystis sp.]MCA3587524.1 hypothetical protein [Methylocystis sp.]MCA3593020.1 hypothetical protein [Methylocystis sp.]
MQFELAGRILPEINPVYEFVMGWRASALDIIHADRLNAGILRSFPREFIGYCLCDGGGFVIPALMR